MRIALRIIAAVCCGKGTNNHNPEGPGKAK